jgi:hypothetical protein
MAQEYGEHEKRNIKVHLYTIGEVPSIDGDIMNDNKRIVDRHPEDTKLNVDDLLREEGNAQGPWTLYRVSMNDDDGKLVAVKILSEDDVDYEKLPKIINDLKYFLDNNVAETVISEYIKKIKKRKVNESVETPSGKRRKGGGRKSRKSSRKSRKNRKSKKSRK